MANEPIITLVGNVTSDPELRFIPSGAGVANFTVAQTPRVKSGDDYVDGEPMFVRCAAWRELGENIAETITKGMRVIVQGRMTVRTYEHNGEKRTSLELDVDAIGPELRFATARVERRQGGGQRGAQQPGRASHSQAQQQHDPWARPSGAPTGNAADPWGTPNGSDEPPF